MNQLHLSAIPSVVGTILKEQRAELNARLDEQATKLSELTEKLSTSKDIDGASIKIIGDSLAEVWRSLDNLRTDLSNLLDYVPVIEEQRNTVTNLRESIWTGVKSLADSIHTERNDRILVAERVTEVDKRVADLTDTVEALPDHSSIIAAQGDAIDSLCVIMQGQVKGLMTDILAVRNAGLEIESRLQSEIAGWVKQVEELAAATDELEPQKDFGPEIREVHGLLIGARNAGDAEFQAIRKDLSSLTDALLTLQEHGATNSQVEAIDTDLHEVRSKLDEIQDTVNTRDNEAKLFAKKIDLELQSLRDRIQAIALVPGPRGEKGEHGLQGERGLQGDRGPEGVAGPPGEDGLGLHVKTWEPGIFIEGTVVQYGFGKLVRAKCNTVEKPENREDWERIGTCGFDLRGVKAEGTVYEDGDIFIDNGSCFIQFNGKARMLVRRGRDGKDGSDGRHGTNGRDGTDGPMPVAIRAHSGGIAFAWDDGTVLDLPAEELKIYLDIWSNERLAEVAGTPILVYQGMWTATSTYSRGDVVTYNINLYLALSEVPAGAPMSEEYWVKLAGSTTAGGSTIPTGSILTADERAAINAMDSAPNADNPFATIADVESGVAGVASFEGRIGAVMAAAGDYQASEVTVDASGFNGNLEITDDTVQKVAQKLDSLVTGSGIDDAPLTGGPYGRFEGTWIEAVGPQGPQGVPGADSIVPGPQGPQGEPGADSTVPGPQGPAGPTSISTDAGQIAVLGMDNLLLVTAAAAAGAYDAVISAASKAEMETGTETGIRRMSPLRVAEAIAALGTGGAWDGNIADIDLNGGVDIDRALVDADLILVGDKKSVLSRVWTYVLAKIVAGIAPYLTGYTIQGKATAATTTDHYTAGTTTLAIPLDGRVYDFDLPDNNIIIDFTVPPTAPVTSDTVLNLKQRPSGTMRGITSWADTLKWPGEVPQTMPQVANARMKVIVSFSPSGIYDVAATWMGV